MLDKRILATPLFEVWYPFDGVNMASIYVLLHSDVEVIQWDVMLVSTNAFAQAKIKILLAIKFSEHLYR